MRGAIWMAAGAVALAVACEAGAGDQDMAETGEAPAEVAEARAAAPACAPSDRMPVEGRTSPYDSTTITVGQGVAKICYGRPTLKGRAMIGSAAVPYDTLWRTGANEPTTIHLNVPASIAGLAVEPGAYSLYTVPRESGDWTLIVNRSTSQWGHESSYTPEVRAQEVGRAEVPTTRLDGEVEQLTIRPMDGGTGAVVEWENTRVAIPIEAAGRDG